MRVSQASLDALMRGRNGRVPSAEHRAKTSRALLGHAVEAETRRKLSAAHRGKRYRNRREPYPWGQKGYQAKHKWVRAQFADPGLCERCGSADRRLQWASIDHTYIQDRSGWLRLCSPCHQRMDRAARRVAKC